mgnify:CR=1 FL=1
MKIQRIATKQTHYIPASATRPQGPFPPEVLAEPKIVYDYDREDSGVPVEGTAQNLFKESKWFRCNLCEMLVSESQIEVHICEA